MLPDLFRDVLPFLVSRISEREESVRLEVFATVSTLLQQTAILNDGISFNIPVKDILEDGGMSPGTLKRKRALKDDRGRKEDEDMIDVENTYVHFGL